ncbi:hypothetical protein L1987_01520 [Smallanthus sonchifolius]|uniref:Uncharacterized protein n=1 Tax=Smallanthus sonchifolius TaxID=185202 RepID=A0ACB9K569_9ASTR|nr:hypothetical protein L1987_01520 [Smallanthus sonchifolius]
MVILQSVKCFPVYNGDAPGPPLVLIEKKESTADLFEVVADDLLTLNKNLQFPARAQNEKLGNRSVKPPLLSYRRGKSRSMQFVPKETLGQVIHDLDFVKTYQRPIAFGVMMNGNRRSVSTPSQSMVIDFATVFMMVG